MHAGVVLCNGQPGRRTGVRGVKPSALRQNRVCETADDMRRGFGIGFSRLLWMHEEKPQITQMQPAAAQLVAVG